MSFPAVNCAPGGRGIERKQIPLIHIEAEPWPSEAVRGVVMTSDLQCFDTADVPAAERTLMSYKVADELRQLCDAGLLVPADQLGVILAGDLYAIPELDKRGGAGDVEGIWHHFARHFRWVAGVAGNHDLFSGEARFCGSLVRPSDIAPLHGDVVQLDGFRIGGVSGIPGNPRKHWRYTDDELAEKLGLILCEPLDILVLHQGPQGNDRGCDGHHPINQIIADADHQPGLIAFGHHQWPQPLYPFAGDTAILSLEARVILFTPRDTPIAL